jgi:hypothetical protein
MPKLTVYKDIVSAPFPTSVSKLAICNEPTEGLALEARFRRYRACCAVGAQANQIWQTRYVYLHGQRCDGA